MYEHLKCFLLKCRIIVITNILGNITREYLQILGIAPKSSLCMEKLSQQDVSECIHLGSQQMNLSCSLSCVRPEGCFRPDTHTHNN